MKTRLRQFAGAAFLLVLTGCSSPTVEVGNQPESNPFAARGISAHDGKTVCNECADRGLLPARQ